MSDNADIVRHFERDHAKAELTELREDGVFRHIEFRAPGGFVHLVLVTWPHNLLVAGSHGSYHFQWFGQDSEDVFGLLRRNRVAPGQWAGKLVNDRGSVEEYDRSRMVAQIKERVADAVENGWAPEGLEAAVDEDVLASDLLDTKDTAFQLVSEFEYEKTYRAKCSCDDSSAEGSYSVASAWKYLDHQEDGKKHKVRIIQTGGFDFDDFYEWRVDKLGYHFVYQCHAIAWGIQQYDAARAKAVA